jgi:hypothetical protein
MNIAELTVTRQALRNQLTVYERITPCCMTCEKLEAGICTQYSAKPPAEWLQGPVDCPEWSYDFIPF